MPKPSLSTWAGAVLPCALVIPMIAGSPALADSVTSAEFAVATCVGAIDDLAKVDVIARAKNWEAAPDAALANPNNLFKLNSAWTVTQGEDKFLVATGKSQIGGNFGTGNICMIMFPGMNVKREEFFTAISASMELKPEATMTLPQGRMEMYEIQGDRPNKRLLQMMSQKDGTLVMASMIALHSPQSPDTSALADTSAVDGSVRAFQALDADTVYVLGTDERLWREFGTSNNAQRPRIQVDGNVRAFQALDAYIVYVLGVDGRLWRDFGVWDNPRQRRMQVDGNVRAFQALDAYIVYVLGANGNLWREFGTWNNSQQPRIQVDGNVKAFQALDANTVYVLGGDGNLWCEFGTWTNPQQPRIRVDGNVSAFQALDANTVYVLGTDGNLWREFGAWNNTQQPRIQVDGNVMAFHALDASTVYVLGTDGKLWIERGTMQTRKQVAANVQAFQALDDNTVYVLFADRSLRRQQISLRAESPPAAR